MGDSVTLRFLIDEDVPRSTTHVLRDAGFDVKNVHEAGLQGKSDDLVFEFAQVGENLLHHLAIVEIGKVRLRG
jgi:hypothetical protein